MLWFYFYTILEKDRLEEQKTDSGQMLGTGGVLTIRGASKFGRDYKTAVSLNCSSGYMTIRIY